MARADDEQTNARVTQTEVEVPGSPEEVWEAIATGAGHAEWLFTAEIEARPGGAMVIRRKPFGGDDVATVTAWDPPHRFAFEEPIEPGDGSTAPPLATEFLVEARSGGTCVVRVVSGLLHDGDGWEDLVEGAGEGWRMALEILRAYLTHFAGQPVAHLDVIGGVSRPLDHRTDVFAAIISKLGLTGLAAGDSFRLPPDAPPLAGVVERAPNNFMLLRATQPCPGLVGISTLPMDGATLTVNVSGRLYGPDAVPVAQRQQPRWEAWLCDRFPVSAAPHAISAGPEA